MPIYYLHREIGCSVQILKIWVSYIDWNFYVNELKLTYRRTPKQRKTLWDYQSISPFPGANFPVSIDQYINVTREACPIEWTPACFNLIRHLNHRAHVFYVLPCTACIEHWRCSTILPQLHVKQLLVPNNVNEEIRTMIVCKINRVVGYALTE